MSSKAYLKEPKGEDGHYHLHGLASVVGQFATLTITFDDPDDTTWALAAWRSLRVRPDALDEGKADLLVGQSLASFGMRLLADMGYALELERCVRCGRACPEGRSAYLDAAGGGLVCSSCGGARRTVSGGMRSAAAAVSRGDDIVLTRAQVAELVEIIEDALAAHTDFDR